MSGKKKKSGGGWDGVGEVGHPNVTEMSVGRRYKVGIVVVTLKHASR